MSPPHGQVPDLVARASDGDRTAIVELLESSLPSPAPPDGGDAAGPQAPGARRRPRTSFRRATSTPSDGSRNSSGTRPCRSTSGCGSWSAASGCRSSTGGYLDTTRPRRRPRGVDLPRAPCPAPSTGALAARLLEQADRPFQARRRCGPSGRSGSRRAAQPHGPDRPGGPGPAPLRADEQRRRRRGFLGLDRVKAASKRYTRAAGAAPRRSWQGLASETT